jgi:2-oxoglutarate ferredoxin oxidoreductase subunit delta
MLAIGGVCMVMSAPLVDAPLLGFAGPPPTFVPVLVASERCKGCALCVDVCSPGVLALDTGVVNALGHHPVRLTDADGCTSCAKCARVCPDAVFTILARARGA